MIIGQQTKKGESAGGSIGGSGSNNYISKFTPDGSTIGNSLLYDSGTNIGIGITSSFGAAFHIKGSANSSQFAITANLTQSNTNPLLKFYKADGTDLLWIHSDRDTNVFVGNGSGQSNTTGFDNSFYGSGAGGSNTTGSDNSFYGKRAGQFNTAGSNGCFFGAGAGLQNTTANDQINIGVHAGENTTTGGGSINMGTSAGRSNITGEQTVNIGYEAGYSSLTGYNVNIGYQAGRQGSATARNVIVGYQAGFYGNGGHNVFLGFTSGQYETGDNKLFIDSISRSSESDARLKSLIYGVFDADPNNQVITFNSKKIRLPYAQTGNSGLSAGDIYFDTAVNILANGDLIAARKV